MGAVAFGATYGVIIAKYDKDFYIYNLGIDIDSESFNYITEFFTFGEKIETDVPGTYKILPTFEYQMSYGAPLNTKNAELTVISPCYGRVNRIVYQEYTNDYEIDIVSPGSRFLIVMDHVNNVQVDVGDNVIPHQPLGKAGNIHGEQSRKRTELQIKDNKNKVNVAPFSVFVPDSKGYYEDVITQLMQDLSISGRSQSGLEPYRFVPETPYAGCYFETLPFDHGFEFDEQFGLAIIIGFVTFVGAFVAGTITVFVMRKKKSA